MWMDKYRHGGDIDKEDFVFDILTFLLLTE
jgi:hypothetical protein